MMDTPQQRSGGGRVSEANKGLVRRVFEEGFGANGPAVLDQVIGPSYVNHSMPAPAPGAEGFKQVTAMFLAAFPDLRVVVEDTLAEGDKVASRGYFAGTHRGSFMGVAATGKPVHVAYIDVWRVADGKLVENWVQLDMLGLMQQLGVAPG
jgi:predicted ester cyclase